MDLLKMYKSVVDMRSSFEICRSSLLRLLKALRRSLLRIDKVSLFEIFGNLKIRNFGYTPSCLQLLRNLMSSLNLFCVYFNFSNFQKSLTVIFPCFRDISL